MSLPAHIALIPDGNRRWAKKRGLPSFFGHRAGAKAAGKVLQTALDFKIPYVSLWGCSIANITKRSAGEIRFLFKLFSVYFKKLGKSKIIHQNKIRIRALGQWQKYFPTDLQKEIEKTLEATKSYNDYNLTFLLAYNGTEEMISAVQSMVGAGSPRPGDNGTKKPDGKTEPLPANEIDEQNIKKHLYTKDLPAVDLVIRTGGDPHLSAGFMMWDVAEAQLYFTDKMWPDFDPTEFKKAISVYENTERRLGK